MWFLDLWLAILCGILICLDSTFPIYVGFDCLSIFDQLGWRYFSQFASLLCVVALKSLLGMMFDNLTCESSIFFIFVWIHKVGKRTRRCSFPRHVEQKSLFATIVMWSTYVKNNRVNDSLKYMSATMSAKIKNTYISRVNWNNRSQSIWTWILHQGQNLGHCWPIIRIITEKHNKKP